MQTSILRLALPFLLLPAASAQSHLLGEGPGDRFGTTVARAGDLDGDGFDDVVVGAPADGQNGPGSGSVSAISLKKGVVLWRNYGSKEGDHLGAAVSGAGDVDQDGYDDVLVGIPGDDTSVGENAGGARLLSGKDGSAMMHWTGYAKGDHFGTSVDGGMDVDLDGYPDMLVGSIVGGDEDPLHGKSEQGEVHVISGKGLYRMLVVEGEFFADTFGQSVGFLGDVDGDEHPDWAAGAPFGQTEGQYLGYVQVRSGKDGSLLERIAGPQDGALFGWSLARVGDADLDGRPDLVVGMPYYSGGGGTRDGRAQVFGLLPYSILNDVVGTSASELGTSVAGIGDASGDGAADFVVGAPGHTSKGMTARGAAFVWRGDFPLLLDMWEGPTSALMFGTSVAGLGNINRGWKPEVLVGVPQDSTNGLHAGAVVIRSVK